MHWISALSGRSLPPGEECCSYVFQNGKGSIMQSEMKRKLQTRRIPDKKHKSHLGKELPCSSLELYFSQKGHFLLPTLSFLTACVDTKPRQFLLSWRCSG